VSSDGAYERFTPEAVRAMADAEPGTWSQLRADVEGWLLHLIQEGGLEELRRGVKQLNDSGFGFREESATEAQLTFTAPLPGAESTIRIMGSSTPALVSADVSIGPPGPGRS
jgi:hypothetical protein